MQTCKRGTSPINKYVYAGFALLSFLFEGYCMFNIFKIIPSHVQPKVFGEEEEEEEEKV
jgi:hypothetical protein